MAATQIRGTGSGENVSFMSFEKQNQESNQQRNNKETFWYGYFHF